MTGAGGLSAPWPICSGEHRTDPAAACRPSRAGGHRATPARPPGTARGRPALGLRHRAAGGRAVAGHLAGAAGKGVAGPGVQGAGAVRCRRHREHADGIPAHPGRGPGRQFRPAAARRRERGACQGRGPRGGPGRGRGRARAVAGSPWRGGPHRRPRRHRRSCRRVARRPRSRPRHARTRASARARPPGTACGGHWSADRGRRAAPARRGSAHPVVARRGGDSGPARRPHTLRGLPPRAARDARHGSRHRAQGRTAGVAAR